MQGAYDTGAGTMATAEASFNKLLSAIGCSSSKGGLTCLVEKDAATVLRVGGAAGPGPVVDGINLKDTPAALIAAKDYNNKVPVIVGSNRDEEAFFTILEKIPANLTATEFDGLEVYQKMDPEVLAELKTVYDPKGEYPYPATADLGGFSIWYWMLVRSVSLITRGDAYNIIVYIYTICVS